MEKEKKRLVEKTHIHRYRSRRYEKVEQKNEMTFAHR